MNVPRRLANWRLVAMLAVMFALAGANAFAQTQSARVKFGPANIYERPRTSSDIFMTAKEGQILSILGREDTWYWVLLPPDGNGMRRAGYIATYQVELIAGTTGMSELHDPTNRTQGHPLPKLPNGRPTSAVPATRLPRYFVSIGGGGQGASVSFADSVSFPLYDESGHYRANYTTPRASALDASIGLRLSPRFALAVTLWRSAPVPNAAIAAVVPDPFSYNAPRAASTSGLGVARQENDGHLQLTWMIPVAPRVDLSIFGGPSLFYVRQDLVSGLSLRESYPYDTVGISGFQTVRSSKAAIGANAGVDVTVMVWRYFGVGMSGRYARGSMTLPSAGNGTVKLIVGGPQVSGGLRMRF